MSKDFIVNVCDHVEENYLYKKATHKIVAGYNILENLLCYVDKFFQYTKVAILTDGHLEKCGWVSKTAKSISKFGIEFEVIKIQSDEIQKGLGTAALIWRKMHVFGMDRKSLLINLGGGIICDLGAFCASTYMRGIDFLQLPTTLLAQVDASIGGKTGFNFEGTKNCIGTFKHPVAVVIDIATLSTLPKREFRAGLGEIIKYALICDRSLFEFLETMSISELEKNLLHVISRCCKLKISIISKDFEENGLRKKLNFGHTLGHALESFSLETPAPLLHGEAVALGLVGEAYISYLMERISLKELRAIENLISFYKLPIKYEIFSSSIKILYSYLRRDKKNVKGEIKWVLLKGIGEADFDIKVVDEIIHQMFKYIAI